MQALILDYGMGNLVSVRNALERLGCEVSISRNHSDIAAAGAIILPGVGAFGRAMENLTDGGFVAPLLNAAAEGKPILGICLGMQLLAEDSEERGFHRGLGLVPGHVRMIRTYGDLRLPHVGWNGVRIAQSEPLFDRLHDGDAFYFVHSFQVECDPGNVAAICDYGEPVNAALRKDRIMAVQFHPERSQTKGLRVLKNFVDYAKSIVVERQPAW